MTKKGVLQDILSNALSRGLEYDEVRVRTVLKETREASDDAEEMLRKTAGRFSIEEAVLRTEVERWRHVNCGHGEHWTNEPVESTGSPATGVQLTDFSSNVVLHVVLHELAHGLVREFDLPVLANEETLADAFATHYLTAYLPDVALPVLRARVQSWMFEAREVPRAEWTVKGEHNSDARRAYQVVALALAADGEKYASLAELVGMSDQQVRGAKDYGTEIHRSWRRLLPSLRMPAGQLSLEVAMSFDGDARLIRQLERSELARLLEPVLRSFDWHSTVTLRFADGEGGAGWNRSRRTITVNSAYVRRFVEQGLAIAAADKK